MHYYISPPMLFGVQLSSNWSKSQSGSPGIVHVSADQKVGPPYRGGELFGESLTRWPDFTNSVRYGRLVVGAETEIMIPVHFLVGGSQLLWQTGKADNNTREVALTQNECGKLDTIPMFIVGYSDANRDSEGKADV